MKYKARFTGADYSDINTTLLWYEYRGEHYCVEKTNNYTMFRQPIKAQHEKAQAEIDERIDNPPEIVPWKYEGSAEEGFDIFWRYCETGGEE